jgi:hypothetical protein
MKWKPIEYVYGRFMGHRLAAVNTIINCWSRKVRPARPHEAVLSANKQNCVDDKTLLRDTSIYNFPPKELRTSLNIKVLQQRYLDKVYCILSTSNILVLQPFELTMEAIPQEHHRTIVVEKPSNEQESFDSENINPRKRKKPEDDQMWACPFYQRHFCVPNESVGFRKCVPNPGFDDVHRIK